MVPIVDFVWSPIYQMSIHSSGVKKEQCDLDRYEKYVLDFIDQILPLWKKREKRIMYYVEKLTSLKWRTKVIPCYVLKISTFFPISSPLTIPIELYTTDGIRTLTAERFIDMLIHELLHVLLIQNSISEKYLEYLISKKFKQEPLNTRIHIPIHAIQKKIFLKFFGEKRLSDLIDASSYYPDYQRSWEIVNDIGEDNIINEMKSYLETPSAKQ